MALVEALTNVDLALVEALTETKSDVDLRPVHNTTQNYALRCVAFASTLVETQYDARIDSDPILALPCVAFLHLVVTKSPTFLVINLCIS